MENPCTWLARSSLSEDWDQDMDPKMWLELNTESHKITVIVRHLLRSSSPKFCADIDWLKQVTQDHNQSWLECLQGWRLYKISGAVLVFNHFPNINRFPALFQWIFLYSVLCLFSLTFHHRVSQQLLYSLPSGIYMYG